MGGEQPLMRAGRCVGSTAPYCGGILRVDVALVLGEKYGDQHNPILSGDPVVAAFDRQNVLEI
jgi:hypothetical protein